MGYEKNGEIFLSIEIGQRFHERNGGGEVQVFGGLVGNEEFGPPDQGPGDQGPLALSAREGPVVPQSHVFEIHLLKGPRKPFEALLFLGPQTRKAQEHKLAHRRRTASD